MHHHTDIHEVNCARARFELIAVLHREDSRRLERRVARQARTDPQTIEDACSFAWLQLLTHTAVDLGSPSARVLGWLTQTATREAWRLQAVRTRDELLDDDAIERVRRLRDCTVPTIDDVADQRARLDLVGDIPQRPRRFLTRLALGYSYREIAVQERVSLTTTNKQLTRARRALRRLEADAAPAATRRRDASRDGRARDLTLPAPRGIARDRP